MIGIALWGSPFMLWRLLHSPWLAQRSTASKLTLGLLAVGVTLLLQYNWFALVIESWQLWVLPPEEQTDLSPTVLQINQLLAFGRKSGWLLVGLTALLVAFRGWRLQASGQALLRAAFNISLFTLIGIWLELLALPLFIGILTLLSQREMPWLEIHLARFALCLLLVGALYWRLWHIDQTASATVPTLRRKEDLLGTGPHP